MRSSSTSFGNPGGTIIGLGENGPAPHIVNAMKRRAQAGGGVNRMAQAPFNPFIQNLDIPQDYYLRNTYKRHFFKTNPIVGAACELNAEFPLSDFHLTHDDEAVEEFLNDMLKEAGFTPMLLMAAMEWWIIGEFNMFSFFDDAENPSCYTGFALLDPNKLIVASNNFVQGHNKEVVQLQFDGIFKKIIEDGPNHPVTGLLYKHLPSDMMDYCRAGRPMPLSSLQCSRMKRGGYFNIRGDSIMERVFPLLMLKDQLRTVQRALSQRCINPLEIWKIGETGDPADSAEIDDFRSVLQQTWYDAPGAIVWHHALNYQCVGAEGRMPNLWPEFDGIDNEVCAGLLINKGLILGDSSTFASDVVHLDILVNRYMMFRSQIEQWMLQSIIAPILKIHEIYVPESKVKSMRYREMCGKGRPLAYPTIEWDKASLRDENAKVQLMTQLVEKKLVPESNLIRLLNIDPVQAQQKIEDETIAKLERHKNFLKKIQDLGLPMTPEVAQILGFTGDQGGAPGGGGPPPELGGIPSSIEGGGSMPSEPTAGLPEVGGGAPAGGATEGIPKQPGVQGAPSQSHQPLPSAVT
jgi:hypothetical protein